MTQRDAYCYRLGQAAVEVRRMAGGVLSDPWSRCGWGWRLQEAVLGEKAWPGDLRAATLEDLRSLRLSLEPERDGKLRSPGLTSPCPLPRPLL